MTDGPRQRSSTEGSAKDAAGEKESGGVALKKEIGLVSACGIIVGEWSNQWVSVEQFKKEKINVIMFLHLGNKSTTNESQK